MAEGRGDVTALKIDRILSLSASESFKRPCARGFQPLSVWISLKLWEGDGHVYLKGSPGSHVENQEKTQHIYYDDRILNVAVGVGYSIVPLRSPLLD
jgi:hypothetical protein